MDMIKLELVYLPEGKYWIHCIYPKGLQAGHFDAPGMMSAVS